MIVIRRRSNGQVIASNGGNLDRDSFVSATLRAFGLDLGQVTIEGSPQGEEMPPQSLANHCKEFTSTSGTSGYSGMLGESGYSGQSSSSGQSGTSGGSGYSGVSGWSGATGGVALPSVIQSTRTTDQSVSTISFTAISFDSDDLSIGSDITHDPIGDPTKFYVLGNGTYLVSYAVCMNSTAGTQAKVTKNGLTDIPQSIVESGAGADQIHACAFSVDLVNGEYVELYVQAIAPEDAVGGKTHFMIQRIGATIGESGHSGTSGQAGTPGGTGTPGYSGRSGTSGWSGQSGYSGLGARGFSGESGYSGNIGKSGYSGISSDSGVSGYSGQSGASGASGMGRSGYSGMGQSGYSGLGSSGYSGISSDSGLSGRSGFSGQSGYSGKGESGYSGVIGSIGLSGLSAFSGFSGFGPQGMSGFSGMATFEDSIDFMIDGGGLPVSTGLKGFLYVSFDAEIMKITMLAANVGDLVVDIWRIPYGSFPPTIASSITGTGTPTITSSHKNQITSFTGWTSTTLNANDTLAFFVMSATAITNCTISLTVKRSQ